MTVAFPPIAPNRISYDLGRLNIGEVPTFGGPVRFRHSSQVTANTINISYTGLSQAQVNELRQHYAANGGTHAYFTVPSIVWGRYAAVSSDSSYRYVAPPVESHQGLYYNVEIVLRITAGTNLLYILDGGSTVNRPLTEVSTLAFKGTAPFILNAGAADPNNPAATMILQAGGASK